MDLVPAPTLATAGALVLQRWQPAWAPDLLAAVEASVPELLAFMPWAEGYTLAKAEQFIAMTQAGAAGRTEFGYALWSDDELVGSASLMARLGPGVLEIGYWVRSDRTGRGIATAAAAALAQAGLALDGIDVVTIRHDPANPASGRVAAAAGFVEVGRQRSTLAQGRDGTGVEVVWERRLAG